eukprot:1602825-Rhodomonas_salina.5
MPHIRAPLHDTRACPPLILFRCYSSSSSFSTSEEAGGGGEWECEAAYSMMKRTVCCDCMLFVYAATTNAIDGASSTKCTQTAISSPQWSRKGRGQCAGHLGTWSQAPRSH